MPKIPHKYLNRVVCGDCLSAVPKLPDSSLDGVLIDPPYGEGMGYEGDDGIFQAEELLGAFLRSACPKVKRSGHVAVFWTMRNLDVCIDVLRSSGFMYRRTLSVYLPSGSARPYLGWLPRTQAVVIGQKYLPKPPSEFHAGMALYLNAATASSGLSKTEIARRLGCDSRLVMKWTRVGDPAWCLPTPRFYRPLKKILHLDGTFDLLLDRELTRDQQTRGDFDYHHDGYLVDQPKAGEMLHPSQKPLWVVEHIVQCLAPCGGVVLDGFAGSGTTPVACRRTGRRFVAVEKSADFCKVARARLRRESARGRTRRRPGKSRDAR